MSFVRLLRNLLGMRAHPMYLVGSSSKLSFHWRTRAEDRTPCAAQDMDPCPASLRIRTIAWCVLQDRIREEGLTLLRDNRVYAQPYRVPDADRIRNGFCPPTSCRRKRCSAASERARDAQDRSVVAVFVELDVGPGAFEGIADIGREAGILDRAVQRPRPEP